MKANKVLTTMNVCANSDRKEIFLSAEPCEAALWNPAFFCLFLFFSIKILLNIGF